MFRVLLLFATNCILTGNAQDYSLRLTNPYGNNSKEGRLEILYSGVWGTVCIDLFSSNSARVACASLGFGYNGAVIGSRYGAGTGQIWLDDVNCAGTETGIELCSHSPWGPGNCVHSRDVSISCDCAARYFYGRTGQISSPNYPRAYANSLICYSYVQYDTGQNITISFLAFSTEASADTVTITCISGISYSSQYSGFQIPTVLTITSCSYVRVYFYTDNSVTYTGFSLTYNITSDCRSRYFSARTGQISSPNYPNAYSNYLDCSSYITVSSGQKITFTFLAFSTQPTYDYVTITCESGSTYASPSYSGSQISAILTITSCTYVKVYFHTDGSTTYTGFNLAYNVTSDCPISNYSDRTGQISSPNYPNAYSNYLDCSSYITVPSGQTLIITFMSFITEQSYDWVAITCETGTAFRSPRYSGFEIPPVLTIASCSPVEVFFHTDGYTVYSGFNLTYNITSDVVIGGFTAEPSNAFPRSDKSDPVIFNCTAAAKYLPRWTMNSIYYGNNYTITNSTCEVNTSFSYSTWFSTESLGPGSCNLILVAPSNVRYLLAGSFICTDSTLASARALLAPVNLGLSSSKGVNFSIPATDIIRDEEMRIACSVYFGYWVLDPLEFIYRLYSGGPLLRMRILRTYWTSQGNIVSSTDISNSSSYAEVTAPAGELPPYTCNIECDFYSNISNIPDVSPSVLSFSTDPVEVFYWPENITIVGDNNGQIRTPAFLYCNADSNPPSTYTWTDESNGNVTDGPTITIQHGGRFTCNASNIIKGQHHEQSKSVELQVVDDDQGRWKLIAIILAALLGAAVLIIIIILIVLLCRKCRKPKRNTAAASDVGHINHGVAHELQPRHEDNSRYVDTRPNRESDIYDNNTDYVNVGGLGRPISLFPTVYEELDKPK